MNDVGNIPSFNCLCRSAIAVLRCRPTHQLKYRLHCMRRRTWFCSVNLADGVV